MNKKTVCILGSGTYGSYLLNRLTEIVSSNVHLVVVEIGNKKTSSEAEIGLLSVSKASKAASQGRYFGLGGTSARWGGQILFFDERENPKNEPVWSEIIHRNNKHKNKVLSQLIGENHLAKLQRASYNEADFKTGLWLRYNKRNLFPHISRKNSTRVELIQNTRVIALKIENQAVTGITTVDKTGLQKEIKADVFYLTVGALESCRFLMQTMPERLLDSDLGKNFGDHISIELFRVVNTKPDIDGISLVPELLNGSLITRRLIAQTLEGRVGFLHPIFNKDVKVFSLIKGLLFGKQNAKVHVSDLVNGFLFLIQFGYSFLFLKKLHVHQNTWSLQLDLEQDFPNDNQLRLSDVLDDYQQKGIELDWQISAEDKKAIEEIKVKTRDLLRRNKIAYEELESTFKEEKIEDVYHPVGFMRMGTDARAVTNLECLVKGTSNLFHFSTALLPSAKAINPTAAIFCLIEEHLDQLNLETDKKE